jgi:hypothetical protein
MKNKRLLVFAVCSVLLLGFSKKDTNNTALAKAIHQVESSGRTGRSIVGDNGKAIGPLQIHYENWKDAIDFDKSIGGKYLDCHDLNYSYKIFDAYMRRYASGKDAEYRARVWNGGPNGADKINTKKYWAKVKQHI